MNKVAYTKPSLTFVEQIDHLESRGMRFKDKQYAEIKLSSISYYRLSGYWYPYKCRDSNGLITNQFIDNTYFSEIIKLYEFDRRLRLLVLDAIERVEVAIRTQFTYHLGHSYDAFGYANKDNFHQDFKHQVWLKRLNSEVKRSRDDFIAHFNHKYIGYPIVPIWMMTEIMSLGALSFGYEGLKNTTDEKKKIAAYFGLHYKKLQDWLHVLTYIRNICAHHSRLWNRSMSIKPSTSGDSRWIQQSIRRNDKIFYILLMLRHLLKATGNDGEYWKTEVNGLLLPVATKKRWRVAMGMPEDWAEHPVWR